MNVLLTSIGRRIQVANFFREVLKGRGKVFAADADRTAPGLYCCDKGFIVPPVNDDKYIDKLISICHKEKVDLIIPFIDPELSVLAKNKELLLKTTKTLTLVSDFETIQICADKLRTAEFFIKYKIPTVHTFNVNNFTWKSYPVIVKPRYGSAGKGVHDCYSQDELDYFARNENIVIQRKLNGCEVTLDVLCDLDSRCLAIVPRKRLKIRAGEVERGITIESEELLVWGQKIVSDLKPIGPINIQCFLTDEGPIFTEINPRFGGGYPLTYFANVNFPRMIIDFVSGHFIEPCIGKYERNLLMLRYDAAIIKKEEALLI